MKKKFDLKVCILLAVLVILVFLLIFNLWLKDVGIIDDENVTVSNTTNETLTNQSQDKQCTYNVEYNSEGECLCDGLWRTYELPMDGLECTNKSISHVCREMIDETYVGREVLVYFVPGTVSLEKAKTIANKLNATVLEYHCDFESDSFMILEVEDGEEKPLADRLNLLTEEVYVAGIAYGPDSKCELNIGYELGEKCMCNVICEIYSNATGEQICVTEKVPHEIIHMSYFEKEVLVTFKENTSLDEVLNTICDVDAKILDCDCTQAWGPLMLLEVAASKEKSVVSRLKQLESIESAGLNRIAVAS